MNKIIDPIKQAANMLLKSAVKGAYDLQKLRVAMGLRLVAQFKVKLGYVPGTKEEDTLEKEAMETLETLRSDYKKITDGVKRELPNKEKFKAEGVIHNYAELVLIHQYIVMEREENSMFSKIKPLVEEHPLWTSFLRDVVGIAHTTAAVIITSIDISKAEYPSSLWKYCGLDVVRVGRHGKKGIFSSNNRDAEDLVAFLKDPTTVTLIKPNEIKKLGISEMAHMEWSSEGRRKRFDHMVEKQLLDKDGEVLKTWKSLPYNPWLKSKLILMGQNFIRSGNQKYRAIYDDYKNRLQNRPDWADESKGHINDAAIRYIVKRFLVDLYNAWRPLEGLPVAPEYSVAKLGMKHKSAEKYAKAA